MEEESESQIKKFEVASAKLAQAKTRALKLKEVEVAVAADHAADAQKEKDAKAQLDESDVDALQAEKNRGDSSVLLETKNKELASQRKMYHEALTQWRRDNGITEEDEKAVVETEAAKTLALSAAKRGKKAWKAAKRVQGQSAKDLTEAESNARLASEAVLEAEIKKNNAQSEVSKLQLQQQMDAEKIAGLSQQISGLRIKVAGDQDAHRVAQTTAHDLVDKADKLARDSLVPSHMMDVEQHPLIS